ncbi:unnamed protein product [Echinostoma caproni]|uniref:C2 domain-containing protein n=1 Tax=Echinostoma caproni TaxID=27848 RepID=A0A183AH34_9TREM|nr:unnamed protein product [Echinostoma caproni]
MASTDNNLSNIPFLRDMAINFNVKNIPLAIFFFVLICIGSVFAVVVIILCIKSCIRRAILSKARRKPIKGVFLDEILDPIVEPGMCGLLTFALEYDVSSKCLQVVIVEAKDLKNPIDSNKHDVYATARLLVLLDKMCVPRGKWYKTSVERDTLAPKWHFACPFTITEYELKNATLIIEVFHCDSLGQAHCSGRLEVAIGDIDMNEYVGGTYDKTAGLLSAAPTCKSTGELCVGLAYLSNPGCVETFIYEARKLDFGHLLTQGQDAIYIQVELKYRKRTFASYETKSKVDLINPYFNEKAVLPIKPKYLDQACVVYSLKKRRTLKRSNVLARAVVGSVSPLTNGVKHWDDMRKHSPRTHVMWHLLVPEANRLDP